MIFNWMVIRSTAKKWYDPTVQFSFEDQSVKLAIVTTKDDPIGWLYRVGL